MSTQHTSGPWLRTGRTVYALMHSEWRKGIEQFKNRFSVQVQKDRECSDEEAEANAILIAAAPDLLEALRAMMQGSEFKEIGGDLDWHSIQMPRRESLEKARLAIAKATGDAS